jgi:hypothetical protein
MKSVAHLGVRSKLCVNGILASAMLVSSTIAAEVTSRSGTLGYIATDFIYYSYDGDSKACPEGLNRSARDWFLADQTPEERARLSKPEFEGEVGQKMGRRGKLNACSNPTEFKNYGLKLFQSKKHYGMNLDGRGTTTEDTAAPNTCAHENFTDPKTGETGIDNQLGRVFGCIRAYREGLDVDKYSSQVLASGEYSILIELSNVDDVKNDKDIFIGIYSGQDNPIQDPTGQVLPFQSQSVHQNSQYHSRARGKIVDGEVISDTFDLRLKYDAQVIHSEFYIRGAKVRFRIDPSGELKGIVGGYFNVATRYEHLMHSGVVTSWLNSYNCPGVYAALNELADGYPDPKTGRCTAISSTMRLHAIPAFVIHPTDKKMANSLPE